MQWIETDTLMSILSLSDQDQEKIFYQEHITSAPKQFNISCDCLIAVALLQSKQYVKFMFMNNLVLLIIIWNKQNKALEEIDLLLYKSV